MAILLVLHILALGILTAVFPSTGLSRNLSMPDPEVEYLDIVTGGGIAGGFQHQLRAYQDLSGYHLYFKDREGKETTYDLTKEEYLLCVPLRQRDVEKLINFPGAQGSDMFESVIRIKIYGGKETEIPRKAYSMRPEALILNNIQTLAVIKKHGRESEPFVKLSERLTSYALACDLPFALSYYELIPASGSSSNNNSLRCSVSCYDTLPKDLLYYCRLCTRNAEMFQSEEPIALEFFKTDTRTININGQRSIYLSKTFEDKSLFFAFTPGTREIIYIISPTPEKMSYEEYENDIIALFEGHMYGTSQLGTALAIEVISLFALAGIMSLGIYFSKKKKAT